MSSQAVATTRSSITFASPWARRRYGEERHGLLPAFRSGSLEGPRADRAPLPSTRKAALSRLRLESG